jgi:Tripartite tricarboxylate transporter family receptor
VERPISSGRILVEQLSADFGKPVVIENRGGASTSLGAQIVAGADKDGYTLLFASATTFTTNPHLLPSIKYKLEDFAPVAVPRSLPIVARVADELGFDRRLRASRGWRRSAPKDDRPDAGGSGECQRSMKSPRLRLAHGAKGYAA